MKDKIIPRVILSTSFDDQDEALFFSKNICKFHFCNTKVWWVEVTFVTCTIRSITGVLELISWGGRGEHVLPVQF